LSDIKRVIEFAAWQKTSGFALDEITVLVAANAPDATGLAKQIVADTIADQALQFAGTVFTQLGLTEAQSRAIVASNLTAAFEPAPGGDLYRLRAGGAAPVFPPGVDTVA